MSIQNFKEQFIDRYQDTFHKVLVARMIANYRLEANLKQGDTAHRFAVDMSAVQVRTITPLVDRTIDAVSNSDETILIDQYKGTTFPISQWEDTLHGNPDLGLLYGNEAAILLAEHTDATILSKVREATYDFDNGDLTTLVSTGTPIDLSTTTNIPKMITRAKAKMGNANRVRGGNFVWVFDDYALSDVAQHVIGRDTVLGDSYFQNGASGSVLGSEVLVSDNLTGEAVLGMATNPTAADTVTINGVVFTFVAAVGATPGNVLIGANVDATRANLTAAINAAAGAGTTYVELSAANRAIITAARITGTNDDTANTLTLVGIGAGRLIVAETLTAGGDTWSKNMVHCYYGKKGAIDVVIAKEVKMKMLQESKQDTMNILNDVIYGTKVFADGKKKMLDVLIQA
jgi:hypothetical protein